MRPWTTRTVQAAVVAAGFAAVGTGAASAAETTDLPKPDLSSIPDQVGFTAPVNACQMQKGAGFNPVKAPCADAQLHASSPNLVKQVGVDIITTGHGVAGELRDGRPLLAPGKPNQVLSHVLAEGNRLTGMTKTRPTIGVSAAPEHLGVLHQRTPNATLLDAEVGPRKPGHQGVSAVDTAIDATAVQGFEAEPVASPVGVVAPTLARNPLNSPGQPMPLPKPAELLPAVGKIPPLAELDKGLGGGAGELSNQLTSRVPAKPVHQITGVLYPTVGKVADAL
ncbi:hypothetical protein SAMN05421805_11834 [Saccharopolyspora antimicrobica]|uniref:Small secreted domain n=1 Tax=Saccharopolyspora antimicrobica TaxID=455193 RepID=A0A1I5IAR4_9PSEU|nr:hypothetical protein [Saccharopolyspora antimicrobica]RKT85564.1 hypothetical protein ATL45_3911 [Saccharopolyspora antimicrobica]SFO57664.1 hypothetical protein SAMN05421805_11834 [Saccharopolyspora antimicrobica]